MKKMSYLRLSAFVGGSLFLVGCETTDGKPTEARKAQDAALSDPFSYGPDAKSMTMDDKDKDVDRTNISGGGTSELDKKAMKRDWDAVWGR